MRLIPAVVFLLLLTGCSGPKEEDGPGPSAKISYADIQPAAGITYPEFRKHPMGHGDMLTAQKRFLLLDRNHDGKLSPLELGGDR